MLIPCELETWFWDSLARQNLFSIKKVEGMRAFTLPLVLSTLNIFKPVLRTLGGTRKIFPWTFYAKNFSVAEIRWNFWISHENKHQESKISLMYKAKRDIFWISRNLCFRRDGYNTQILLVVMCILFGQLFFWHEIRWNSWIPNKNNEKQFKILYSHRGKHHMFGIL